MAKGNILSDSFEQLAELGQSTVKQGVKQVTQTFSPIKLFEHAIGKAPNDKGNEQLDEAKKKTKSSTPLNFEKLAEKYHDQEKVKMESLRNHLFQLVKREDEKLLERRKIKEEEKKRKEEQEKEEKKKRQIQQQQAQQVQEEPRGKIRQSIFSPKKVAKRAQTEVRPASGKQ